LEQIKNVERMFPFPLSGLESANGIPFPIIFFSLFTGIISFQIWIIAFSLGDLLALTLYFMKRFFCLVCRAGFRDILLLLL